MKKTKRIVAFALAAVLALLVLAGCKSTLTSIAHKLTGSSDEVQEEDTTQWAVLSSDPLMIDGITDTSAKYATAMANGSLNIVFRTQSAELIAALTDFFRLWARIENVCLAPALGGTIACSLYDGRFVRPLAMPRGKSLTADDVAGAISAYVQLFDRLLKGYLDGSLTASDVEMAYRGDLRSRTLLI